MTTARLTFAPTPLSADAYFLADMRVTDAFAGLEHKGKFYAVASSLELGNFQKNSRCDKVFSLESLRAEVARKKNKAAGGIAAVIALAAKKIGARDIQVGADFPAGMFGELKKHIKVNIAKGALFPERAIKTAYEQKQIAKANGICAAGIALCAELMRQSKVVKGKLFLRGVPLTSEFLRRQAQELFLQLGAEPHGELIIAGGQQACNPHEIGHGQLKARELIVVDFFAPLQSSHYWGDMTRTFIKGQPSDAQARLVEAVADAQRMAIDLIAPGVSGAAIHDEVQTFFKAAGYHTSKTKVGYEGFFHGTGHSLGLECHDMNEHGNGISKGGKLLRQDEVYTVEPGLYYPAIGGCRIEDNGVVTKEGFKLLSRLGYGWVL